MGGACGTYSGQGRCAYRVLMKRKRSLERDLGIDGSYRG
jgi:hypothetical protein